MRNDNGNNSMGRGHGRGRGRGRGRGGRGRHQGHYRRSQQQKDRPTDTDGTGSTVSRNASNSTPPLSNVTEETTHGTNAASGNSTKVSMTRRDNTKKNTRNRSSRKKGSGKEEDLQIVMSHDDLTQDRATTNSIESSNNVDASVAQKKIDTDDTQEPHKMTYHDDDDVLLSNLSKWIEEEKKVRCGNADFLPVFKGCQDLLLALDPSNASTSGRYNGKDSLPTMNDFDFYGEEKEGTKNASDGVAGEEEGSLESDDSMNIPDPERERLQKLPFVNNLCQIATKAVNEAMRMTDKKRDPSKFNPDRQRMSRSSQNSSNLKKAEEEEDETNMKEQENEPSIEDDTFHVITAESNSCATLRTKTTFNTIFTLIPPLHLFLYHIRAKDKSLKMDMGPTLQKQKEVGGRGGGKRFKGQKKKEKVYLFTEQVYSVASLREFQCLKKDFERLLFCCNSLINNDQSRKKATINDICRSFRAKSMQEMDLFNREKKCHEFVSGMFSQISDNGRMLSEDVLFSKTLPIDENEERHAQLHEMGQKIDDQLIFPLSARREGIRTRHELAVQELLQTLRSNLSKRFRNVQLQLYGSCLSDLSLGQSSDVDISFHIPEFDHWKHMVETGQMSALSFDKKMKSCVYTVMNILKKRSHEYHDIQAVVHARVPVVKAQCLRAKNPLTEDESISFDICFLNDIAVVNSTLIKEYSLIDPRVKHVLLAVKSWIKLENVGSAVDGTMSSYTWMILVIFYLQSIGFVPNLQCPDFIESHGIRANPSKNRWHGIDGLNTVFLSNNILKQRGIWKLSEKFDNMPASFLLSGFFTFYVKYFPYQTATVSMRLGKCALQKTCFDSGRLWRLCIEDPFEAHFSHCPHDLGSPISELGQEKIMNVLSTTAKHFSKMFDSCSEVVDAIGRAESCNPEMAAKKTPTTKKNEPTGKKGQHQNHGRKNAGPNEKTNRRTKRRQRRKDIQKEENV